MTNVYASGSFRRPEKSETLRETLSPTFEFGEWSQLANRSGRVYPVVPGTTDPGIPKDPSRNSSPDSKPYGRPHLLIANMKNSLGHKATIFETSETIWKLRE